MLGKFITFEGIDGAGKSTHISFLANFLRARGLKVVTTREPGGSWLGEQLRTILLNKNMHVETETLLMFAARREHLVQVIEPALVRGDWVISDRFTDTTFAYQGGGKHLSLNKIEILEKWVHSHLQPNITLFFDVPISIARMRLNAQAKSTRMLDRFEEQNTVFFNTVRAAYFQRVQQFPQRFRVLNSMLSIVQVQQEIIKILEL